MTSDDTIREGGCACGAVRFGVQGDPIFVNNCHCRQCQCQTGSTSVVNAFFEIDRLTLLSGDLSEHTLKGGSGNPHAIIRCSACGTALWSYYHRLGRGGCGLRVGTLDDSAAFGPDAAIFVDEKMPWVALPEGIPAFRTTYDARKLLPSDRYERLVRLLERQRLAKETALPTPPPLVETAPHGQT